MAMDMIRCGGLLFLVTLSGVWEAVRAIQPAPSLPPQTTPELPPGCVIYGNAYGDGTYTIPEPGSESCHTFTCRNRTANRTATDAACHLYGQCIAINSTLDANCTGYTCSYTSSSDSLELSLVPSTPRCLYQGQCLNNTGTVVSNCVTRTCNVQTLSNGTTVTSMQITSVQCQGNNGACYASGERYSTGSGHGYCWCTVNGTSISYACIA